MRVYNLDRNEDRQSVVMVHDEPVAVEDLCKRMIDENRQIFKDLKNSVLPLLLLTTDDAKRVTGIFAGEIRQGRYRVYVHVRFETPFNEWRKLASFLSVLSIELTISPNSPAEKDAQAAMLIPVAKMAEFVPLQDIECPDDILSQTDMSLSDIADVCTLVKTCWGDAAATILENAAEGTEFVIAQKRNGIMSSVMFVEKVGDGELMPTFITSHQEESQEAVEAFRDLFVAALGMARAMNRLLLMTVVPHYATEGTDLYGCKIRSIIYSAHPE